MAFVRHAASADQFRVGIGKQSNGVGIELDVRAVFLAVAGNPIDKFLTLFRRFDTDTEDLHFPFHVTLGFIDKGRHLGPAPRSPTAAIEKNDGRGDLGEHSGKLGHAAFDVQQPSPGEIIIHFESTH